MAHLEGSAGNDPRSKRTPPRGRHPSLSRPQSAGAAPSDFLGLDPEITAGYNQPFTQLTPHEIARAAAQRHAPQTFAAPSAQLTQTGTYPQFTPPGHLTPIPPPPSLTRVLQHSAHELGALVPPPPPVRTNSWLLTLDDARAGRAGVAPVIDDPDQRAAAPSYPAHLEASFAEAPPVATRTVPWLVGGLIAAASVSFLFVVGYTLLSPKLPENKVVLEPITPKAGVSERRAELADPGRRRPEVAQNPTDARGRNTTGARPTPFSPVTTVIPPAAGAASNTLIVPRYEEPPPTFIEIAPPDFAPTYGPNGQVQTPGANSDGAAPTLVPIDSASLPRWHTGLVHAAPLARNEAAPGFDELAGRPERREQVQQYLMAKSRARAPGADASATYTPPVVKAAGVTGVLGSNPPALAPQPQASSVNAEPPAAGPAGVWEGAVVPVDQIQALVQILTPRVGLVRVTLASGDVQEGRLYAVGQGQIWIDGQAGRATIARARIERLEQIGTPAEPVARTPDAGAPKSEPPAAEERVRVRADGGLFYGRIVAREGQTVTLITDDGARVTVEAASIDPAPERKTIVKRDAAPKPPPVVPLPVVPAYDPDNPHGLRPDPTPQ
ncbi:MAG: hypothetical protein JNL28_07085 [Planctomycetes bacterium]|nr:hypothetical protein [Planctomycetota bacterium]